MTPRRVVHLIDRLDIGGAEKLLVTAAEQAQAQGWDMRVVCLTEETPTAVHGQLAERDVRPVHVPSSRQRTLVDTSRARQLRRVIRALDPDVLHTHLRFSNILGPVVTGGLRTPRVATLHTIADGAVAGGRRDRLEREALRRGFGALVAVGPTVAATQERRIGRELTTIPNPVAANGALDGEVVARVRTELLGGSPGPLLIMAGRLTQAKGLPDLLRALELVRHYLAGATLAIAGDGELRGEMEALSAGLGVGDHVRFLGTRSDLPLLLRAADAFVLSSVHEGLPLVVLEAMAAGCPVVATDVGDVAYALDGAGLLVPPTQYCHLASAIIRLLADPGLCRRLGERGRDVVAERHSPSTWAARLDAVYDQVTGVRHG